VGPYIALALVSVASAATYPEEDDVVVLSPANFDSFISEHPISLVEFYAPWCGHCKELTPKWAEAAKRAKKLSPPIPLAKVDADAHREIGSKYDVTGFPTIKIFQDGVARPYDGPREANGIIAELGKLGNYKPPTELKDADAAKALAQASSCLLVGFFRPPVAASAAYKTFMSSALELAGRCTVAWSATAVAAADPVGTALELEKGVTPGLLLLSKGMLSTRRTTMKLPRNKAEFTVEKIMTFVDDNV